MQEITTLFTNFSVITVNCYLVKTGTGYFLIDTGLAKRRADMVKELESAGCHPGNLKLIILTHGDLDHSGNAAYLRERYGAKIAMHSGDLVNVESGDMFANKNTNPVAKTIARIMFFVTGMGKFTTFTPDLFLADGQNLSSFGWDATVIHVPGHSKGSIAILTSDGDLFCGDLLENTKRPSVNSLGDDLIQLKASAEGMKKFPIKTVYPGHGSPFQFERLFE